MLDARPFIPLLVTALLGCPEPSTPTDAHTMVCATGVHDHFFNDRIAPLLLTDRPASCGRCHLGGVDLSLFVREDACSSMACLVELGLVDLEAPENSLILDWIRRATPDSALITQQVIDEEHQGFLDWISYQTICPDTCADAVCTAPSSLEVCPLVPIPQVVIDHTDAPEDCSERALEALFTRTVYPWRGRCYPCHFSDHAGPPLDAPRWLSAGEGCEVDGLRTMRTLLDSGYVDLASPADSLILLKPLAVEAGGVEHGGHDKFQDTEDTMYVALHTWITRQARCQP
jgi:hypothetical protein